jgi:hypothetical protein
MITPLELPPAMANIIVNCRPKKGYIQLQWMTKEGDARDPRYNAEYVVRAEPKTGNYYKFYFSTTSKECGLC